MLSPIKLKLTIGHRWLEQTQKHLEAPLQLSVPLTFVSMHRNQSSSGQPDQPQPRIVRGMSTQNV